MPAPKPDFSLLTISHAGDLQACQQLCASIDRLMPDVTHRLVVEKIDRKLFSDLATANRKILTTGQILPELVLLRRTSGRRLWISPYKLRPVDGWHLQQLAKLALAARLPEQAIVVVDSDVEFVRPLRSEMLLRDGRTRFLRYPIRDLRKHHVVWNEVGANLLGIDVPEVPSVNYVHSPVIWRPEVVRALLKHIAKVNRRPWKMALCRQRTLSEYYFYGQFVDYVDGPHRDTLFSDPELLAHGLLYDFDPDDPRAEETFLSGMSEHHVAFGIQSNIGMPEERRAALVAKLRAAADTTGSA